jgi:carbohydrate kinase (thermoresistant glucokinase family)
MNSKSIVIMGVSGCGKSTVGKVLSNNTGIPFFDADDYHPQSNIDKMQSGIPLTDKDRLPWLETLHKLIQTQQQRAGIILACSALKRDYRTIMDSSNEVKFIYLEVSQEELVRRLNTRNNHYMPASLLDSQLATLELSEEVITVNGELSITELINQIRQKLQ